jgi:L-arabinose isomerase
MNPIPQAELWFVTGSQHLYGPASLKQVAENSARIVDDLNRSKKIPLSIVFKPVMKAPEEIRTLIAEANAHDRCAGLILWMHTFSPAKMWIGGLCSLRKPFLHWHTQFNRDLPWSTIDMDFMNLNQAAHGDREAAHLHTRLRLARKVVVGHRSDNATLGEIGDWSRAVLAWHDAQGAKFARLGDNMRQVSVTEGDKVSAEARFGFSVNGYGIGDLVARVQSTPEKAVNELCREYEKEYALAPVLKKTGARHASVREAARIELGLRAFLTEGGFKGFTTTFEDLHGLRQLPGLAVQRLMADGYGFGAEGDWKTAALLRAVKVMGHGLKGGTSFMEDYTYHLDPKSPLVLGSHMLEVCPTIAEGKPKLQVHPLGIGGKDDPARLVFDCPPGSATNSSLVDLGNRFRLVINEVDVVRPTRPIPKLPVARALWKCRPNFKTACTAWLLAGGAHHTALSYSVRTNVLLDFARIAGIEALVIDADTTIRPFQREMELGEMYHHLNRGIGAP